MLVGLTFATSKSLVEHQCAISRSQLENTRDSAQQNRHITRKQCLFIDETMLQHTTEQVGFSLRAWLWMNIIPGSNPSSGDLQKQVSLGLDSWKTGLRTATVYIPPSQQLVSVVVPYRFQTWNTEIGKLEKIFARTCIFALFLQSAPTPGVTFFEVSFFPRPQATRAVSMHFIFTLNDVDNRVKRKYEVSLRVPSSSPAFLY